MLKTDPSRDEAIYDPHQKAAVSSPYGSILNISGIPRHIVLGPSFFEGFKHQQARWVFGIPFVGFNRTNTLSQARLFLQNVDNAQVEALEVGNEPDLYNEPDCNKVPQPQEYVSKWQRFTKLLADNLPLPHPIQPWQGLVLARAEGHCNLTMAKIFSAGVDSRHNLRSVSMHYYQHTNSTGPLSQETLLNHTYIKEGLKPYSTDIQWLRSNNHSVDFVLGETGRYPIDRTKYPASIADGNFGTVLWTVDMMLHAMTIGVTRINMQLGITMSYAAWHPVHAGHWQRAVRGPFYAHVFVADAISRDSSTTVHELANADDEYHSVYGIYNSGHLHRIAIVNLERYVSQSPGALSRSIVEESTPRPAQSYKLNLTNAVDSITIHKLSAPDAEALSGISYDGKQWLIENDGKASNAAKDDTVTMTVDNGIVSVAVDASQAVLIHLHRQSNDTKRKNRARSPQQREL